MDKEIRERLDSFPYAPQGAAGYNANAVLNTESIVSPTTANAVNFFAQFGSSGATYVNILINRDGGGSQNVTASSNAGATTRAIWGTIVYEA